MKIVLIGRERSDYGREIRDYQRDFKQLTGREIQVINPDSKEGEDFCRAYGIVEYPTILAVADSGQMQQMWRGKPLPLINELSYYK